MRTLGWPQRKSVLVVYYAETGILDLADGTRNVAGVVAVPDVPGEADDWAKRWGVIIHGEDRKAPAPLKIGRAHVCTPVTNAPLVCRLLLEKKKKILQIKTPQRSLDGSITLTAL